MSRLVSVLMSIYNEPIAIISESIDSLLKQTYQDFEIIIVCDNPKRKEEITQYVESFGDKRLILVHNSENNGLACSMNVGFEYAKGDIIARMDADDVAELNRFEKQIKCFEDSDVDFVFSRYTYIDEKSNKIDNIADQVYYDKEELKRIIPLIPSIIHHPTVMFTRELFLKSGGYRNFPCAQDNDLWLRMYEVGANFMMLKEHLLKYRINSSGITSKRWFQQQLTVLYTFRLSVERLEMGCDSFSEKHYMDYLIKHGLFDSKKEKKFRKAQDILSNAALCKENKHLIKAFVLRVFVFVKTPLLREYLNDKRKKKKMLKK